MAGLWTRALIPTTCACHFCYRPICDWDIYLSPSYAHVLDCSRDIPWFVPALFWILSPTFWHKSISQCFKSSVYFSFICRKIFLLILFVLSVTTDNWYSVPSPRNHLQASLPSPQSRISRFILLYVNQAICFTLPRDNAYLSGTLVCLTTFEMCRLRHTIKVNLVCLIKVKGTISRQP